MVKYPAPNTQEMNLITNRTDVRNGHKTSCSFRYMRHGWGLNRHLRAWGRHLTVNRVFLLILFRARPVSYNIKGPADSM